MKKRILGTAIILSALLGVFFGNVSQKQTAEAKPIVQIENEKIAKTNTINVATKVAKKNTKNTKSVKNQLTTVKDGKIDKSDFSILIDDVVVSLGDDFNKLQKQLPEADKVEEVATCIGSGVERVYTYGDVTIYTNVGEKNSMIYIIELKNQAKTSGDIGAGAKVKDIEKIYGKDYSVDAGVYTFTLDQKEMNFYVTNGEVETIEYYMQLE